MIAHDVGHGGDQLRITGLPYLFCVMDYAVALTLTGENSTGYEETPTMILLTCRLTRRRQITRNCRNS